MAARDVREELRCSICLELYTEPVTVACGHSFCRPCIDRFVAEEQGGPQCPECRAPFPQWPPLQRSIALCNVVQHFRSVRRPDGAGIFCSYCLHSPAPAVRSCLHCEASLCDDHLIAHSKSPQHVLSDPGASAASLERRKCPEHKEVFRYHCTVEGVCICAKCQVDGAHQGHATESLEDAAGRKKAELRNDLPKLASERKETERRLQRLRTYARITGRQPEHVSNLIKLLEVKLEKLCGKTRRLGEMFDASDPLTVLCNEEMGSWEMAEDKEAAIETLYQGLISEQSHNNITLDIDTAANNVRLSPDLKTLTWAPGYQGRPETPSRFQYNQVLSSQILAFGSHSWDVEAGESGDWRLGVACHSATRTGDQAYLGDSDKSWCLRKLYSNQYSVMHGGKVITTSHQFSANRFRVSVDCEAGRLSFYELSDPIQLLHTFTANFSELLHAAFGTGYWLASENCWIRVSCPET